MTQHSKQTSDFDIAKDVTEKLNGLEKAQQERILRWVNESLGLQAANVVPQNTLGTTSPHNPINKGKGSSNA